MTLEQQKFAEFLESLVHKRFSKKELTTIINNYLGASIEIDWHCFDDGYLSDYDAMFTTADHDGICKEIYGDFDLYYLDCKPNNEQGTEVYITEVGYEFWYNSYLLGNVE